MGDKPDEPLTIAGIPVVASSALKDKEVAVVDLSQFRLRLRYRAAEFGKIVCELVLLKHEKGRP